MERNHGEISTSIECGSKLEIESDNNDERASGEIMFNRIFKTSANSNSKMLISFAL